VPAIECFTAASDLVSAFERAPAQIVILDEDASASPPATVIHALRKLERGARAEVIVLSRSWSGTSPSGLAELGARELPKPISAAVLSAMLRSARARAADPVA